MIKKPNGNVHSEQIKAIVLIMMLTSVILIAVAVIGSFWVTRVVSRNAIREYEDKLQNAADRVEQGIDNYRKLADQYSNAFWVKKIAYMQGNEIDSSRVNVVDLEHYRQTINLQCSFSNAYEICLVFWKKDLALGAGTRCNLNYMVNNYLHVDGMSLNDWTRFGMKASVDTIAALPNVHLSRFGNENDGILLAFPVNPPSTKNAAALFVVLRHRDFVDAYFDDLLKTNKDLQLNFLERENSVPFLTRGQLSSDDVITISTELNDLGITAEMNLPKRVMLNEVTTMRNFLLLLVLLLWIASAILSSLISRRLFTPLRKLLRQLENHDAFQQELSEYETLQNGIEQLIERETVMKQELAVRQDMLRNAQIERLLGGIKVPAEELVHMSGFDVHAIYCVCLLLWETDSPGKPLPGQIEEVLQENTDQESCEGIVFRRPSYYILVIGYAHHEELEKAIITLLDRWKELYVAIGEEKQSIVELSDSLTSARKARDYRCVAEGYRVLRLDNISQNISYYLPQEQENMLTQYVSCGQEDKAKNVFNDLYQKNMSDNTTTEIGMQNLIININLILAKLLSTQSKIDVMEKVNREESIPLLHDYTERNIELASEWCRQKWMSKSARMDNLLNYVDANLTEPMLSLEMVANHFGISPSLVSRLFAEQHGERFHDYINKQRIQKSLDLLISEEKKTDISGIAAQMGYTSDATFRRLFKKYIGVSPSEYRASMLKL